jgi:DnaJ-class molecular chaperone
MQTIYAALANAPCTHCAGTGLLHDAPDEHTCPYCLGRTTPDGEALDNAPCLLCGGTGYSVLVAQPTSDDTCPDCMGSGLGGQ